ncbi:MAG: DMT family transporter [Balneolaceae bacterium]|nr:MAG: DMT family transporter [Balneolaceae bacterium]
MAGWFFILLCAATSTLIAHFFKITEHKKLNTTRVLTVNYLIATFFAVLLAIREGITTLPEFSGFSIPLLFATAVGFVFIANFFIYSKSVHLNGVGISVAAMRVSLLVPVFTSILWYQEVLSTLQWVGILIVFGALFLLLPNKRKLIREPLSAGWLLVILFVGTGIGDASLMVYEEEFSAEIPKEIFMGAVFFSAFLIGSFVLLIRRNYSIKKEEWVMGAAIGIPNLLTSIFLILALEQLTGAIVYSSVNILTVLGATCVGVFRWGDIFTKAQWTGIALALAAILLLL